MDFTCSKCHFSGKLPSCIRHFLLKHVDPSDVAFYCSLCGFRGNTRRQFDVPLLKSSLHKKLAKNEDRKVNQNHLREGTPYNVTWGKPDSDLLMKREREELVTEDVLDLVDPEVDKFDQQWEEEEKKRRLKSVVFVVSKWKRLQ